jgi:HAD superfamily hydrolase (TIGR01450 family)
MRITYVTNNAARSSQSVAQHLCELGLRVLAADVVTSAQAGAAVLAALVPRGSRVFVLGSRDLMREVESVGLSASQDPDGQYSAVIQGYWPDMPWRMLAQAAGVLHTGVPWVATNMDLTIPTPWGRAPGNGSMVNALATAVGRRPVAVAGKPEVPLMKQSIERARSKRPLAIGDRLDTDILGANNVGIDSVLVLSGVTTVHDLLRAQPRERPTFVAWDATCLQEPMNAVVYDGAAARLQGWQATAGELTGTGDVLDAIRVACVGVWRELLTIEQASVALRARGVAVG